MSSLFSLLSLSHGSLVPYLVLLILIHGKIGVRLRMSSFNRVSVPVGSHSSPSFQVLKAYFLSQGLVFWLLHTDMGICFLGKSTLYLCLSSVKLHLGQRVKKCYKNLCLGKCYLVKSEKVLWGIKSWADL